MRFCTCDRGNQLEEQFALAKKQAQTQSLDALEAEGPKEHINSNVPSENLNTQESGEVIGYENCAEEWHKLISQKRQSLNNQEQNDESSA